MGEWPRVTIGELCDRNLASLQTGPFGSQLHAHEYRSVGTPVIPTEAIGRRRVLTGALPRVDAAVAERLARHRLHPGDILFARRGAQATGSSAIVDKALDGAICGTGAILLRVREPGTVDPEFLSFSLASEGAIQWLREHAVGAVMPNLNTDIIRRLQLLLPPLPEQRAIAHILGTLDDKIELNRRTSETLEAMARALFKSWFVDFDPVRAKARGEKPAGMDEATAKLFPSELVDSELGPVPKGWRVARLEELVELAYGKALPKSTRFSGHVPVYGSGGKDGTHSVALVSGPGIIIGRKGTVGSVYWSPCDFFPIDTTFYVRLLDNSVTMRWAHEAVRSIDIAALGADSAVPGVNRHALGRRSLLVPPPGLLSAYERSADPFWARADALEGQAITLERTRDALLPKLLSGELSVREVA